jgi:mono/diheme cytochrome c family protein
VLAAVGLGVWLGTRPPDAPEASAPPAATPTATAPAPTPTAPVPARDLFVGTCGSCHSLDAAGATAGIGPDLDELRPDRARVAAAIANGSLSGAMPAGLLAGDDAARVAAYVARSAGG